MARCDSVGICFKEILQQDFSGRPRKRTSLCVSSGDAMALKEQARPPHPWCCCICKPSRSGSAADQRLTAKTGPEEAPIFWSSPSIEPTADAIDELALRLWELDLSYGERLSARNDPGQRSAASGEIE